MRGQERINGEAPGAAPRPTPSAGTSGAGVYYQAPKPAALELPDQVTLPGGDVVRGAEARVYALLLWAAETQHRFAIGRHLGPPAGVPTWALREPWSGGAAGDRRLRDLRDRGIRIDVIGVDLGEGEKSASKVYRIVPAPTPLAERRNPREKSPGRISGLSARDPEEGEREPCRDLAGLVVWLALGERPALLRGEALDATPGSRHRLAPSTALFASLVGDGLSPAEAEAWYLRDLRRAWADGDLAALSIVPEVTLWADPDRRHGLPAHEILAGVLGACGAEVRHV